MSRANVACLTSVGHRSVTEEETEGVVHHLLDVVEPTDVSFNVVQYCRLALDTIADIHKRGGRT